MRRFLNAFFGSGAAASQPAAPASVDWKKKGNDHLARGELQQAAGCYRQAIAFDPADTAACLNLGFVLGEQREHDEARHWLQQVLDREPGHHEAHFLLARVARAGGDLRAAARSYARAAELQPAFEFAHLEGGQVLLDAGDAQGAQSAFERLVALRPQDPEAHAHLGLAWESLGRLDEAEACHRRALEHDARQPQALFGLANVLLQRRKAREALPLYEQVLAILPDHVPTLVNLAQAQAAASRFPEAEQTHRRLLERQPQDAVALCGLANAVLGQKRPQEALVLYDRLLAIQPEHAQGHLNRGNALLDLQREEEAFQSFQRALRVRPDYVEALVNIGTRLQVRARHAEAVTLHRRALQIDPGCAEAHWNLAVCLLLQAQWEEGWREAEWRWQALGRVPPLKDRLWTGEQDLHGKTLLVYSEQGLGDTIQFSRYLPLVAARAGRVLFSMQKPLRGLLAGPGAPFTCVDELPPPESYDYQVPLLSLPLALGTTPDTVPPPSALAGRDPARRERWRERLAPDGRLLVGVVWSGNPSHTDDRKRSLPFEALAPLAIEGVRLVSLQKEVRESDRAALAASPVLHVGDELADFRDTAALVECMDLVISVDTSVAHLAATMGTPTWVLLPLNPDWRWMLQREDTPWYPSVRLFRQEQPGDWRGVLTRVRDALHGRAGAR